MDSIRRVLCAALCAGAGACAAPEPPPHVTPPEPPHTADGEYRGTSTRFQASTRACPHPGLIRFDVVANTFEFRWDPNTFVNATIAPDGTVTGSAERITLLGMQHGTKIEGDVTSGDCGLHFTAAKRP